MEVLGLKVVELTSTDWSTLTPAGLNQRLADQGSFPSELKPAAGTLPATYGFRTREGGSGLLQIVAFGKGNFAAMVRFKLLARSAGE